MLVSGNCHSRNRAPIPVAAPTNTNAQSSPRRAAFFKNLAFVTAAFPLPLFTGNYSLFSKGKQGKSVSAKVGGGKIKRFSESRNRSPKGCVGRTHFVYTGAWGSASTSRKTIRSTKAEWMVFRICIYRCIACRFCSKFGIIVASNAYGAPYAKNAHFRSGGSVRFLPM